MRFMLLVKASPDSEAGVLPSRELVTEMGRFNEEMARAGVMLAGEGLQPSSHGSRVRCSGDQRTVIDGPFTEARDLVAGFWLIQVASKEEAIEWASRIPFSEGEEVEVRQVFETSDFPPEVMPREEAEREQRLREQLEREARTS